MRYRVEEILSDEALKHITPPAIWIWADKCKQEQGSTNRTLFMTNDCRMVAELCGRFSIREEPLTRPS